MLKKYNINFLPQSSTEFFISVFLVFFFYVKNVFKRCLIIIFTFSLLFVYGQKERKIFLYIQNQLYKRTHIVYDSTSQQLLLEKFYQKIKPIIILDSIVKKENEFHYYHSFLPKKITLTITDTSNQILLNKKTFFSDISEILSNRLKKYENNGYPFAYAYLDSIYFEWNKPFAWYKINHNTYYTYDSLDVIGKLLVRKSFLHSFLNIKPGKCYKEKDIKQMDHYLASLPFYKTSKSSEIFFINNRAKPRIFLEKNHANEFYGLIGFGSLPNKKLNINGELQIQLNNLLKQADSWQIQWKKTDAFSQNMHLEGSLPYILSNPLGVSGLLNMKKQDSSYLNLRYNINFHFYVKGFNGFSLFVERRQTNVVQYSQANIAPLKTTLAGISFTHKHINSFILPTKGYGSLFSLAYGKKHLLKNNNLDEAILSKFKNESSTLIGNLQSFVYLPINKLFLFKIVAEGGYMNIAHFRNELFRNGGSKSIRGFDEESIYSKSYIIATVEPRIVIDKNTQLLAFIDKMFYESLNRHFDYPWSLGVGAEIKTTAGLFFITYALGSQLNQTIDFKTAKIHFGYKNQF